MRVLTASDRALLVETADLAEAMRMGRVWGDIAGVTELVPGARSVLVRFDPTQVKVATLVERLRHRTTDEAPPSSGGEVVIRVRYDGEDLDDVAELLGVSTEEVVTRHLGARWQAAFVGFAPGFCYIVGADPLFNVPRRQSPRVRVPAGSVGLAGTFTGVYPRDSPGGWQLIGSTDAVLWDINRDTPALLTPGFEVHFERAARRRMTVATMPVAAPPTGTTPASVRSGIPSLAHIPRRVDVVKAAFPVLVQDAGRPGHAHMGVTTSGTVDRIGMRDANRAVGNTPSAAILECAGGGTVLRFHAPGVAAVTGAYGELSVTDESGTTRPVTCGAPFAIADGDTLALATPTRGLRYIVGVRGGIDAPVTLGSRATDILAGLGPDPLHTRDTVAIGDPRAAPSCVQPDPLPRELPKTGDTVRLRITLGPRDDWFTPAAVAALTDQDWYVTPRCDRVGIRLHGAAPLERARPGELPSEGTVAGALEVPPEGQPVLFLADHPLTGGYPVIAAVTDRDLDLAGQLPPGTRVRFTIDDDTHDLIGSRSGVSRY